MENDTQYKDKIITEVRPDGDGHTITTDDGWSFSVPSGPIVPQVGMTARFYGQGLGFKVRGLVIDGHTFFYQTAEDFRAEETARYDREMAEQRRALEAGRTEQLAAIARLPEPFQERLNGFMARRPETARQHQGYELATCEAAVAILETCADAQAVQAFKDADYAAQIVQVPALDEMGLSGNMVSKAIQLAYFMRTRPEFVAQSHATICPLVGCEKAGCWALEMPVEIQGRRDSPAS